MLPDLHAASFQLWSSNALPDAAKCQVLKARFGQTWTMNRARTMNRPYAPGAQVSSAAMCPLCRQKVDTIGHMLGECEHEAMKGLTIDRHNAAGRMILKAIHAGAMGACLTIADVGSEARMAGLETHGTRIPEPILRDMDLPEGPEQRAWLRPDILLLEDNMDLLGKRGRSPAHTRLIRYGLQTKVWVIEIGYSSDTRYRERLQEKRDQHAELCSLLAARGYAVELVPIILGSMGSIYRSVDESLRRLGVAPARVPALLHALTLHAMQYVHKIIRTRRQLEHSSRQQQQRPDPP